jgi:hypothetical protein
LCSKVVSIFKKFESGDKTKLDGKVIDLLLKDVEDYLYRISNLMNKIE